MKFLISLAFLTFFLWIGYMITGAILKAFIWLFIGIPLALTIWSIGLVCCCTLILIPVGMILFGFGFKVLTFV